MSQKSLQEAELINSIQSALDATKKEVLEAKKNEKKVNKRKQQADRKVQESNLVSRLDSLIDELLAMKEGERKAQLVRKIVPIEEWINNEYYCGAEVFNLYPFWKKHLLNIYNSPVKINEVILTGRFRYW
nr:MAG TPA: hypothetical protein [Caudoviricetes sp.]